MRSAGNVSAAAIRAAEEQFDLIVVDTAPILLVPDAIPLLSKVEGVVVVGRLRRTKRAALGAAEGAAGHRRRSDPRRSGQLRREGLGVRIRLRRPRRG